MSDSTLTNKLPEEGPQMNRAERRRQEKLARTQPMRVKKWRDKMLRDAARRKREQNRQRRQEEKLRRAEYQRKLEKAPVEGITQVHLERRESRYAEKPVAQEAE